jgi:hypothetical protein
VVLFNDKSDPGIDRHLGTVDRVVTSDIPLDNVLVRQDPEFQVAPILVIGDVGENVPTGKFYYQTGRGTAETILSEVLRMRAG